MRAPPGYDAKPPLGTRIYWVTQGSAAAGALRCRVLDHRHIHPLVSGAVYAVPESERCSGGDRSL